MDTVNAGQPLTTEQRAYTVGQLTMLKSIAAMIEAIPIVQLDRAVADLDEQLSDARMVTFTWGTIIRREDLELVRMFVKFRGEIMALRVARHARVLNGQAKVQRADRN